MSETYENILQNDSFLSANDLPSPISPSQCNTNDDDQFPKQILKFVEEPDDDIQSPLRSSSTSSLPEETSDFSSYGVDWSDRAKSTTHCWFPYLSTNSSTSRPCSYSLCENTRSTSNLSLIQCATCLLTVHAVHLSELQETTTNIHQVIPSCRPSFIDSNTTDNIGLYDQHHWSFVSPLTSPCTHCKRKSLKDILYDNAKQTPTKPKDSAGAANVSVTTCVVENVNPKLNESLSDLICMWCSRSYHRRCWQSIKDNEDNNKCNYGKFGNIVVRPQWLRRIDNSSFGFRAEIPNNFETNSTPVIFFINKLSGGKKGQQVYRTLIRLVNPRQVFLLENDTTIIQALKIYSSLANTRICICGGDGTVAWILSHLMDTFMSLKNPPASIYPLGTGNDMSRVLGWGHQYKASRLLETLTLISRAHPMVLDRWKIQIEPLEMNASNNELVNRGRRFFSFMNRPKFIRNADQPFYENHRTPINTVFFNYISFGLDAAIVLDYHARRTRDPSKFTSPFKNKILCINEGRKYFNDFAFGIRWNLASYMRLICDGQDLTDALRHCHSLVVLNTRSFGSGTHPWGKKSTDHQQDDSPIDTHDRNQATIDYFEAQNFSDRKIEVLGLNTKQMALLRMGIRGDRIAQCSQIRIELNHPMPVHMDGGPFYLPGSVAVNITHAGQVMVLSNGTR